MLFSAAQHFAPRKRKCWRRPIFPGRFQPSIFGTDELNFRVRNGNGWTLIANITNYLCQHRPIFPGRFQPSIVGSDELNFRVRNGNGWTLIARALTFGAPSGIRTRDPLIKSQLLYQLS